MTNLPAFNRMSFMIWSQIPNPFDFQLRKFEIVLIRLGAFTMLPNFPSILQPVLKGLDTLFMLADSLKTRLRIDIKRYIPNLTIINHILLIILSL